MQNNVQVIYPPSLKKVGSRITPDFLDTTIDKKSKIEKNIYSPYSFETLFLEISGVADYEFDVSFK